MMIDYVNKTAITSEVSYLPHRPKRLICVAFKYHIIYVTKSKRWLDALAAAIYNQFIT